MRKFKFSLIFLFGLFSLNFLHPQFCFAGGGEYDFPDDTGEAGPAYFGLVRAWAGVIGFCGVVALFSNSNERI